MTSADVLSSQNSECQEGGKEGKANETSEMNKLCVYDLLESTCLGLRMLFLATACGVPGHIRSWSRLHEHGVAHQQMHHSACPNNSRMSHGQKTLCIITAKGSQALVARDGSPAAKADISFEALRPAMICRAPGSGDGCRRNRQLKLGLLPDCTLKALGCARRVGDA